MEEPKDEPRTLICNKCNWYLDELDDNNLYVFRATMAPLLSHIRRIHLGYQPYLCSHCPAVYPTLLDIFHHIQVCHDGNFMITSKRDRDMERRADEEMRRILTANGDLDDQSSQNQNGETATRKDILYCSACNYRLEHSNMEDTRIELVKMDPLLCHLRRVHFGYQPFKCGHCQGFFPTLLDIERHMECAHKGEWQVTADRKKDIESEVKQILANHQHFSERVRVIHNDPVDNSVPAQSSNSEIDLGAVPPNPEVAGDGEDSVPASSQELDMQPIVRLERCTAATSSAFMVDQAELGNQSNEETSPKRSALSSVPPSDLSRGSSGSKGKVIKYDEFIRSLSTRGLPGKRGPGRPGKSLSQIQADIYKKNIASQREHLRNQRRFQGFVTTKKPPSADLKTYFDDDFGGVSLAQHRMSAVKCPKCSKVCKAKVISKHIRQAHNFAESKDLFVECKLCGSNMYRQVAHLHPNVCLKRRTRKGNTSYSKNGGSAKGKSKIKQNGYSSLSGRSLRSDSRNNSASTSNETNGYSGKQNGSNTTNTPKIRRQFKRVVIDNDVNSEDGEGSFWDFSNQG